MIYWSHVEQYLKNIKESYDEDEVIEFLCDCDMSGEQANKFFDEFLKRKINRMTSFKDKAISQLISDFKIGRVAKIGDTMNKKMIASELIKIAKDLVADDEATKAYEQLLKEVENGRAILLASSPDRDIPTIHDFAGKYRNSVEHCGYGMFRGETENGSFDFDGGGAMKRIGQISWTYLNAEKNVLSDLDYNFHKVATALKALIARNKISII